MAWTAHPIYWDICGIDCSQHSLRLPQLLAQLNAAFAHDAPYWRETGYGDASAEKQYFTFSVRALAELRSGAREPEHAVEALVRALAPLTGRDDLVDAEW